MANGMYCPDKDTCKGWCGECKVRLRVSGEQTTEEKTTTARLIVEAPSEASLPASAAEFFKRRFARCC